MIILKKNNNIKPGDRVALDSNLFDRTAVVKKFPYYTDRGVLVEGENTHKQLKCELEEIVPLPPPTLSNTVNPVRIHRSAVYAAFL